MPANPIAIQRDLTWIREVFAQTEHRDTFLINQLVGLQADVYGTSRLTGKNVARLQNSETNAGAQADKSTSLGAPELGFVRYWLFLAAHHDDSSDRSVSLDVESTYFPGFTMRGSRMETIDKIEHVAFHGLVLPDGFFPTATGHDLQTTFSIFLDGLYIDVPVGEYLIWSPPNTFHQT